jgi:hypothetical protein
MPYEQYDKFVGITNDPRDFKMPHKVYGKTDLEVMKHKYQHLHNFSKGLSIRFQNGQENQVSKRT